MMGMRLECLIWLNNLQADRCALGLENISDLRSHFVLSHRHSIDIFLFYNLRWKHALLIYDTGTID